MWRTLWFIGSEASLPASTYLLWYAVYAALFALFYIFSSPFQGNRELRKKWTGYVYVSTILYVWLGMAVAFHLPILQYDVKVPVSLFSPLFLASALTLFACEGALKLLNRWFVFHLGFRQNSLEVMQNSFVVSLACCFVYSQCGSVTHEGLIHASRFSALRHSGGGNVSASTATAALELELDKGIDNMCVALFSGHVNSKWAHLPMVVVLWSTAMAALVLNFFIERISGFRGMFAETYKPTAASIALANAAAAAAAQAAGVAVEAAGLGAVSTPEYPDQQLLRRTRSSSAASDDSLCGECVTPRAAEGADQTAMSAEEKARQHASRFATSSDANAAVHAAFQSPSSPSDVPSPSPSPISSGSTPASGPPIHPLLSSSYKSALHLIRPNLFREMLSPPMLEMVPWYALLTTFTGVDMLIHMRLFVGRFDMRTLQAAIPNSFHYTQPIYAGHDAPGAARSRSNSVVAGSIPPSLSVAGMHYAGDHSVPQSPRGASQAYGCGHAVSASDRAAHAAELGHTHAHPHHLDAPLVYDQYAQDDSLWFDWMADCGDGWNPSYQVCRVLAKPLLNVSVRRRGRKPGALRLPRAKMLLIGGDLAYPNPSEATYESRLFRPFQCALPPPLTYDPSALSMHKPPLPGGVAGLADYDGPTCFAIPGNHDWFDGLQTYLRYICARDWLGGWLLPQERSFFALQLPKGWWLFGLDNALSDDIDALQFKYFASLISRMDEDDRVIIATHEPDFIIDTHDQRTTGENTNYLIKILKGKVALRIAGDIHNYTRHMPSPLIPGVRSGASSSTIGSRAAVAFNASAASTLFRGVMDRVSSVFSSSRSSGTYGDEDEVTSGLVDATLSRAAEAARLHAEEEAERAAQAQARGGTEEGEGSYTSMLYSRWTGWGGDGEGVFLEDIIDDILPDIPLLRTQSMPAFSQGAASAAAAAAAASKVASQQQQHRAFPNQSLDQDQAAERNVASAAARRNRKKREARRRREEAALSASASTSTLTIELSASGAVDQPGLSSGVSSGAPTPRLARAGMGGGAGSERQKERSSRARTVAVAPPQACTAALDAISNWSVAEVLDWLSSIGVEDAPIHDAFSAHDVDGVLLQALDETDLAGELGVGSGLRRKKIMAELRALVARARREDAQAQTQAPQAGSEHDPSEEELSSDNSAAEQLTLNILSGSSLELSSARDHDWNNLDHHGDANGGSSGSSSNQVGEAGVTVVAPAPLSVLHPSATPGSVSDPGHSLQLPPALPSMSSSSGAPGGLASTPRARSGPELSLIAPVVSLGGGKPAYGSRNVDLVSQPLVHLADAVSVQPLPLHPGVAGALDASVGLSATARKRLAKKKRAESTGIPAATLAGMHTGQRSDGPTHRSSDSSTSTPFPEPRPDEQLFGAVAMRASASPASSQASNSSGGGHGSGDHSRDSRHSRTRPSGGGGSVALYNHPSSVPIPTDLRESINICLPDGKEAPRAMMLGASGDVGMDSEDEGATAAGDRRQGGRGRARAAAADATAATLETAGMMEPNVRPPPVLIVSGGGGAFMHPTHCPDPEPILFRGNRYVRASSYPPVALSRAYALLNLFGFRKQNWRFDMFGGVLYFLLVFSILPVCNLSSVINSATWYDALWQYALAVVHNHSLIFLQGYVSLFTFASILIVLISFGEAPWPWYKRLLIGSLHTLAHSLTAVSALVLLETAVELGRARNIIGQGEGELLYGTFTRNFPGALRVVEGLDESLYVLGVLVRWLTNLFDVPDSIAVYKKMMCESYATMSRPQVLIYYFNCSLYLWLLMAPAVSFMFGAYLYIASSFLNAHYTEAFSSLRIEGYKNIVRFHINTAGDLEVYTLGMDKVPKRWERDPKWSGNDPASAAIPSHKWARPSVMRPEKGQPNQVKLIDYLVINKNPRSKQSFVRPVPPNQPAQGGRTGAGAGSAAGGVAGVPDRSASGPPGSNLLRAQAAANAVANAAAATSTRGPTIAQLVVPGSPGGGPIAATGTQPSVASRNARRLFTPHTAHTLTPQPSPQPSPLPSPTASASGTGQSSSLHLPHRRELSKSSANLRPPTSRPLA